MSSIEPKQRKKTISKFFGVILLSLLVGPFLLQFQNCAPIGGGSEDLSSSSGDLGDGGSLINPGQIDLEELCRNNQPPELFTQLSDQNFAVGMEVGAGTSANSNLRVFGTPGQGETQAMSLRCRVTQTDSSGNSRTVLNVGCNNQNFQVQDDGSYRATISLRQANNTQCMSGTVEVRYRAEDQCGASTPERVFSVSVSDACRPEIKLVANDARNGARLGSQVDIDGNFLVVSADGDSNANGDLAGAAYVFRREGANWVQEAKLLPQDDPGVLDRGGLSAVAILGQTVALGVPSRGGANQGAVYIFRRGAGGTWSQTQRLDPVGGNPNGGDWFGFDLALSASRLAIGAPRTHQGGVAEAGAVYSFVESGGVFILETVLMSATPLARSWLGFSIDTAGNRVAAGAPVNDLFATDRPGSAVVFQGSGTSWTQTDLQMNNTPNGARYGFDVALHGNRVAVGAPFAGSGFVAVFAENGGNWSPLRIDAPRGTTTFGSSLALQVNTLLIGAPSDNSKRGAVFHFDLDGSAQQNQSRFKIMARDRNNEPQDPVQKPGEFGSSVAVDAGLAAIGSWAKFLYANELNHTNRDVDRGGALYLVELLQ